VNFAQGDLLMLGAFTCYMLVVWYGAGYWLAFALAVATVALFGAVLGRNYFSPFALSLIVQQVTITAVVAAAQGLVSVGVWFAVVLLPLILLPLLALLLLVGLARRRARRKRADAGAAA